MYKKLLLLLTLSVSSIFAEIVSHKSMVALNEHIAQEKYSPEDIIVIFDIDNTIAHPKTEVGSDQWVDYQIKKLMTIGVCAEQAYQDLSPLYYELQHIIDLHLVEDMIPDLITNLNNTGISTLGLTARRHPLIDRTITQLEPLGITFSTLADQELIIEDCMHPAVYKKGIIFCGLNNKGEVLFYFLNKLNLRFKKIFFIDDKMHHLIKVEKAAQENGVEYVGIHYTQCLERVKNFNPEQAERELLELIAV